MLEVDFITLGDASERLNVPPPTLRNWTDQLEEFRVHYTKRNNRNERLYYESDLKVFAYLRDLKEEYGRRATTKDLAYMIADKGREGEFDLRSQDDAPIPQNKTNKTSDLLGQEDIKRLMESERVKQFMQIIVRETTKSIKEELKDDILNEIHKSNKMLLESMQSQEEKDKLFEDKLDSKFKESEKGIIESMQKILMEQQETIDKKMVEDEEKDKENRALIESMKEQLEEQKKALEEKEESKGGFWSRLFKA